MRISPITNNKYYYASNIYAYNNQANQLSFNEVRVYNSPDDYDKSKKRRRHIRQVIEWIFIASALLLPAALLGYYWRR